MSVERMKHLIESSRPIAAAVVDDILTEAPRKAPAYDPPAPESETPAAEVSPGAPRRMRVFEVELFVEANEEAILDEVNRYSKDVKFRSTKPKAVRFPVTATIEASSAKEAQALVLDIIRKVSEKSRFISGGTYRIYKGA